MAVAYWGEDVRGERVYLEYTSEEEFMMVAYCSFCKAEVMVTPAYPSERQWAEGRLTPWVDKQGIPLVARWSPELARATGGGSPERV